MPSRDRDFTGRRGVALSEPKGFRDGGERRMEAEWLQGVAPETMVFMEGGGPVGLGVDNHHVGRDPAAGSFHCLSGNVRIFLRPLCPNGRWYPRKEKMGGAVQC